MVSSGALSSGLSMRTGMEAVYTLLNIDRGVPEMARHGICECA